MFNGIAKDYDFLNHVMSLGIDRRWRKVAIGQLTRPTDAEKLSGTAQRNVRILDVACGTGDFSIAAARQFARKGISVKIDGIDISEGMLDVMKDKVGKAGLGDQISMGVGDGENIPFEEGTFDRVTIAFGIRNFENKEAGLREMLRVLRPGGKIAILELSLPENKLMRSLFNLYFFGILPRIGGKVSGDLDSYKYLPASVAGFPGKEKFMAMMRSAGFSDVAHRALTFGICRLYTAEKPQQ